MTSLADEDYRQVCAHAGSDLKTVLMLSTLQYQGKGACARAVEKSLAGQWSIQFPKVGEAHPKGEWDMLVSVTGTGGQAVTAELSVLDDGYPYESWRVTDLIDSTGRRFDNITHPNGG